MLDFVSGVDSHNNQIYQVGGGSTDITKTKVTYLHPSYVAPMVLQQCDCFNAHCKLLTRPSCQLVPSEAWILILLMQQQLSNL